MSNQAKNMFNMNEGETIVELHYAAPMHLMDASDFAEAVLGLEKCMKQVGLVSALDFDGIAISPLEEGSIKTTFRYIKKHPMQTVANIAIVSDLLINSFSFVDRLNATTLRNPTVEVLNAVKDKKVLDVCHNLDFLKGGGNIAKPIDDINSYVKIVSNGKTFQITCENKVNFQLRDEGEQILPELVNGTTVSLQGEITRINKTNNDLGFKYKDRVLTVIPMDEELTTTSFHQYLELNEVILIGEVIRDSLYTTPKIKVRQIEESNKKQTLLFEDSN